jgi:hypothetical protein
VASNSVLLLVNARYTPLFFSEGKKILRDEELGEAWMRDFLDDKIITMEKNSLQKGFGNWTVRDIKMAVGGS